MAGPAGEGGGSPSPSSTLSDIQTDMKEVEKDIKDYRNKLDKAEQDENMDGIALYGSLLLENTKRLAVLEQRLAGLEQDAREARRSQEKEQEPVPWRTFQMVCAYFFTVYVAGVPLIKLLFFNEKLKGEERKTQQAKFAVEGVKAFCILFLAHGLFTKHFQKRIVKTGGVQETWRRSGGEESVDDSVQNRPSKKWGRRSGGGGGGGGRGGTEESVDDGVKEK